MADERYDYEKDSCEPCVPLKENCESECCEKLKVRCDCIDKAECVPILSERIFDCICLESVQFAEGDVEFVIENWEAGCYRDGSNICIDKVGITYDFIGAIDTDLPGIRVDGDNNFIFQPPVGSGYTGCTDINCPDEEDGTLYDEYVSILTSQKFCCDKRKSSGVKVRIFGSGIRLYVCNAIISVVGRIGNKPFRGTFKFEGCPGHPFEITSIPGINPLSVYGRLCVPAGMGRTTVYMELKPCASIDCVQALEPYMEPQGPNQEATFLASVEGSLLVNTILTSTVTEKLAVFTTPNGVECHKGNKESGCKSECDEKRK